MIYSNPHNPYKNLIFRGHEIILQFNHSREPNRIVETVEQMLLNIGLPVIPTPAAEQDNLQEEGVEEKGELATK